MVEKERLKGKMLKILSCIISIIGTIVSVLFIENGYVTLGVMISINCFFFVIAFGTITSDIDELKCEIMVLQSKLDYIIEREHERHIER